MSKQKTTVRKRDCLKSMEEVLCSIREKLEDLKDSKEQSMELLRNTVK